MSDSINRQFKFCGPFVIIIRLEFHKEIAEILVWTYKKNTNHNNIQSVHKFGYWCCCTNIHTHCTRVWSSMKRVWVHMYVALSPNHHQIHLNLYLLLLFLERGEGRKEIKNIYFNLRREDNFEVSSPLYQYILTSKERTTSL